MNFKKIGKIIAATAVASCGVLSAAVASDCKNPEVIRFSMIPTEETTQELALYEPLVNQIKAATSKNVEFFLPTSYASVVEAMLGGFVDLGMHGSHFLYFWVNTDFDDIDNHYCMCWHAF